MSARYGYIRKAGELQSRGSRIWRTCEVVWTESGPEDSIMFYGKDAIDARNYSVFEEDNDTGRLIDMSKAKATEQLALNAAGMLVKVREDSPFVPRAEFEALKAQVQDLFSKAIDLQRWQGQQLERIQDVDTRLKAHGHG